MVKEDGGVWKFLNASSVWTVSPVNDLYQALRQAMVIAANQMSGAAVNAMASADWAAEERRCAYSTQYLDIAIGLWADANNNRPYCTSFRLSYNDVGTTTIEGFIEVSGNHSRGTDATEVNDIPWARSGIIGGAEATLDYAVQAGVSGHFIRILTNGTSPDTTLRRILYKAPVPAIGQHRRRSTGYAEWFIYFDASTTLCTTTQRKCRTTRVEFLRGSHSNGAG